MPDVQITLAAIWVVVMLIYLLRDVLRIFSGDFPGKMDHKEVTHSMWLAIAILGLIPILMIFLSVTLDYPVNRPANIIVAAAFFVFNLINLRVYPSAYDKFLLIVTLVFNALTVWYAWNWA